MTLSGVYVPGLGNETLPVLLPASIVERVCPSIADGVNVEGEEPSEGGENWNEDDGKGAGVIPDGREGCSGLLEFAL